MKIWSSRKQRGYNIKSVNAKLLKFISHFFASNNITYIFYVLNEPININFGVKFLKNGHS